MAMCFWSYIRKCIFSVEYTQFILILFICWSTGTFYVYQTGADTCLADPYKVSRPNDLADFRVKNCEFFTSCKNPILMQII